MKKLAYLLLSLVLAAALCACGGDSAHVHDYEKTVITPATCTTTGVLYLKCTICGDSYHDEIPATAHTETTLKAVAPTCNKSGLTEGKYCSVCNEVLIAQEELAATGEHLYTATIVEATCTSMGSISFTCSCGDNHFYYNAEMTGHTWSDWKNVSEATCTESGLMQRSCTKCNFNEDKIIPGSHRYKDGTCILCSKTLDYSEGLEYSLKDDKSGYILTGLGTCTDSIIRIPETYQGLPVTEISNGILAYNENLEGVIISKNIEDIGEYVLRCCPKATVISVDLDNQYYRSEGNCLIERATGRLIAGCMTSVIPTDGSITVIENDAFSGHTGLVSVYIPVSVTRIGINTFENCGFTAITYEGTMAQWEALEKGTFNNNCPSCIVHCADGDISK